MRAAVTDATAAILIEPVQGEGGVRALPDAFLRDVRALCDETGALLVLDEVQSGVGRTGRLFAHEWAGITPDLMAVAKGIGGGFPMGVCLASEETAAAMVPGTHGTTYGGNPLAMAVGNAVLDVVLADGFLDHIRDVALVFKQGLEAIVDRYPDVVTEIRGRGLMLGLKAGVPNGDLVAAIRAERLLAVPAGDNVVRLLPPLVVTAEEAREGLARIEAAAAALSPGRKAATA
jgi:acetylornithine/N-succinyldiaminopimelate aminotransferase